MQHFGALSRNVASSFCKILAADAVYSKFNGYMPNEINLCYTEYIDCNILNYTGGGGK